MLHWPILLKENTNSWRGEILNLLYDKPIDLVLASQHLRSMGQTFVGHQTFKNGMVWYPITLHNANDDENVNSQPFNILGMILIYCWYVVSLCKS